MPMSAYGPAGVRSADFGAPSTDAGGSVSFRHHGKARPRTSHATRGRVSGQFGHGGILPAGSTYDGQLRPWLKSRGKGTSRARLESGQDPQSPRKGSPGMGVFPTAPRPSAAGGAVSPQGGKPAVGPQAAVSNGAAAGAHPRWVPAGGIDFVPSKRRFSTNEQPGSRYQAHTRDESLRYFGGQPRKVNNIATAHTIVQQGRSSRDIHHVLSPTKLSKAAQLNAPTVSAPRHPDMGHKPAAVKLASHNVLAKKTDTDECPIVPMTPDIGRRAQPPQSMAERRRMRKLVAIHGSSVFAHLREGQGTGWTGPAHDSRSRAAQRLGASDDADTGTGGGVGLAAFANGGSERTGAHVRQARPSGERSIFQGSGRDMGAFANGGSERAGSVRQRRPSGERRMFQDSSGDGSMAAFVTGGGTTGAGSRQRTASGFRHHRGRNLDTELSSGGDYVASAALDMAAGMMGPGIRVTEYGSVDVVSRAEYEQERRSMARQIRAKMNGTPAHT